MRMTPVDWLIPLAFLATLVAFALRTNRHARSVAGFLAGNRCAGRYLVAVAFNMAQVGIISLVWFFQQYYDAGYTSIWWGLVENPLMIVIALTGWVAYRFRETRALTLAQFLEMRYSRGFRVFCGFVAFVAGFVRGAVSAGSASVSPRRASKSSTNCLTCLGCPTRANTSRAPPSASVENTTSP